MGATRLAPSAPEYREIMISDTYLPPSGTAELQLGILLVPYE